MPCPAVRPHFFGACPKKRCRAAKEKRFFYLSGSTIRVSASASVVFTHLRPTWGGAGACRGIVRVRRFLGCGSLPPTADSTPFLCSCAKKRGGAPKKRAFGCRHGSCSVPPASPTDSKPQHHSRLRQADFAWPICPPCTNQLDAPICPVGAYAQMGEAGGTTRVTWRLQSAFLWRLDPISLGKHQRNGVERQGKVTKTSQRNGAHAHSDEKKRGNPRRGFPLGPPPALL